MWSIHTLVDFCTVIPSAGATGLLMLRLRITMFVEFFSRSPPPVNPEDEPTPSTVVLEPTSTWPLSEMIPLTLTVLAAVPVTAVLNAARLVTVTAEELPPPVVPAP